MSAEGRVVPPSRRRDKAILSCTLCRRRKLKCDRQQPCKTCIDRGLSLSCTFVRNIPAPHDSRAPNSVHDRIDQLERLVTTLMDGKENSHQSPMTPGLSHFEPSSEEEKAEIPDTPDRVKLSSDTTSYSNSGHWTSILDGISELKEHLDQVPTSASSRDDGQGDIVGPDLLFGRQRHATKQELLAALPQRPEADQMIATYFDLMDTAPTLLHRPSFLREYEEFWKRPFEVSTMWLALLYSILAIGARFQAGDAVNAPYGQEQGEESLHSARLNFYREKVVQALILANYTKCPPYTIETLALYFGTEYVRSPDTQFSMWVLAGMIVRMAFRMGYHRDPSRFANISPFRGEIRRRHWLLVVTLDLVSSAQVGLPRMIQPFMYDTQEPRNLEENDLYEDMAELPPSRPEVELTPLLYTIVLSRARIAQSKITDLMNSTTQPSYREIMDMDATLRRIYGKIPESPLQVLPSDLDGAVSRSSTRRLYLGLTFLKAILMLHKPYLLLGRTDSRYEYSRRVCVNAAFQMLELQQKVDAEIRPGGKLWAPGWQIFTMSWSMSTMVAQDFLLATTVLILDLDAYLASPAVSAPTTTTTGLRLDHAPPSQQEIIDILRAAQRTWNKSSRKSYEARKVAEAIRLVLIKADVGDQQVTTPSDSHNAMDHSTSTSPLPAFNLQDFTAAASNANFFGMGEGGYSNTFLTGDMSMDMGNYSEAFNWNQLPPELPTHQYGPQYYQPPF